MVDLNGSFVWADLNVDDRKKVWYAHLEAGGQDLSFDQFVAAMDQISTIA